MYILKGILGIACSLALLSTIGEANQAPSSVKNRIEMFENLAKGNTQNNTDWTAHFMKDDKKIWERRGLFIEGLNVFDEREDKENIFVVKSPEEKLLAFGYEDNLKGIYEKLKPGQKIRAFLEIAEEFLSESAVKEINKLPSGYYADSSNRSSGLYVSKVIHIKGTHKKFGGKNVFSFKSPVGGKFIELKYANPAMANALKSNQALDAYVQLRENPNDSVVVSMDFPPERYITRADMKSQNRPATSVDLMRDLAINVPSLADFLKDEKNTNIKLQQKHVIDVQYAQIQKDLGAVEVSNELIYQILLKHNAMLKVLMKSADAHKYQSLLIEYYEHLCTHIQDMTRSAKDKPMIDNLVKNYKTLYEKLKGLKEDAAKNEMVKTILENHEKITERFVERIDSTTTNKGTSYTAEGYPNFVAMLVDYYTFLRLAVIRAR